jgi:hypothetical protein
MAAMAVDSFVEPLRQVRWRGCVCSLHGGASLLELRERFAIITNLLHRPAPFPIVSTGRNHSKNGVASPMARWVPITGGESNNAANLSEPKRRLDCRIKSGNDDMEHSPALPRHCEERSDEAIQLPAQAHWIASLTLAMTA